MDRAPFSWADPGPVPPSTLHGQGDPLLPPNCHCGGWLGTLALHNFPPRGFRHIAVETWR